MLTCHILYLRSIIKNLNKLTSTGDGLCQYNTGDSNKKEFHRCFSLKVVLYSSEVESTKVLFLEKNSSFIAFLYQNWRTCYPCGVVTLSVCLVPLELVMYTKHVYQLQRSN